MNINKEFEKLKDLCEDVITDDGELTEINAAVDDLETSVSKLESERDDLKDELLEMTHERDELRESISHRSLNEVAEIITPIDTVTIFTEKGNLLITEICEAFGDRLVNGDYKKILAALEAV